MRDVDPATGEERDDALYYELVPVFPRPPGYRGILNAAAVTCIATGRILAGAGGGGNALSVDVAHAIDSRRNGYRARMVLDAVDYDLMRGALAKAEAALAEHAVDPDGALEAVRAAIACVGPETGTKGSQ